LIILFGVSAIWVLLFSALVYLVAAAGEPAEPQRVSLQARGLERPRTLRPNES
jgi:hypothetical protein